MNRTEANAEAFTRGMNAAWEDYLDVGEKAVQTTDRLITGYNGYNVAVDGNTFRQWKNLNATDKATGRWQDYDNRLVDLKKTVDRINESTQAYNKTLAEQVALRRTREHGNTDPPPTVLNEVQHISLLGALAGGVENDLRPATIRQVTNTVVGALREAGCIEQAVGLFHILG